MNRVSTDLLVYLSKGRDTLDHDPTFMAWKSTATNLSNLLVLTFSMHPAIEYVEYVLGVLPVYIAYSASKFLNREKVDQLYLKR